MSLISAGTVNINTGDEKSSELIEELKDEIISLKKLIKKIGNMSGSKRKRSNSDTDSESSE